MIDPWTGGVPPLSAAPANPLDLAGSESCLGCSKRVGAVAVEALRRCHQDPRAALHALRAGLSRRFSIQPTRISVAAGTRALLPALVRALADGGGVLVSAPAPPLHALALRHAGAGAMGIPLADMGFAVDAWERALQRGEARLAVLSHPHNPTGAAFQREELLRLLAAAEQSGVHLVLDEAYAEYAASSGFPRAFAFLDDFPRLIVARTFSSLHGLAGLPAAFAVSSAETAARLEPFLQGCEPGEVAARAASAALEDTAFEAAAGDVARRGRFRVKRALDAAGVVCHIGEGPWVLLGCADADAAARRFAAHGVLTRSLAGWGFPGHVRVRAGREDEIERFLEVAVKALKA